MGHHHGRLEMKLFIDGIYISTLAYTPGHVHRVIVSDETISDVIGIISILVGFQGDFLLLRSVGCRGRHCGD